ncbi:hypothetical protein AGMMS49545_08940 [Betaproteobacteria bacterium]|nr:hypothetical protein AGMMS49545_08940 [Betaproteobacteria bacterium]GHU43956.1 hypothetical protein AGMMS50289_11280 [Betaproteobacteria bacterium]
MPGLFAFALGIALPLGFWVCRWLELPFWWCGLLLLPVALTQGSKLTNPHKGHALARVIKRLPAILAVVLGGAALIWRNSLPLLYYPVLINAFFLFLFAISLKQKQTLIERLARRLHPDLPESGVRYTRQVTKAWCLFFIGNGALALWSIGAGEAVWALYNGGIAYGLMGLMFAGEWLARRRVMKKNGEVAHV